MPNIPGLPSFENGTKRARAPRLGEHTREVLLEHDYSEFEIATLIDKGVGGPGPSIRRRLHHAEIAILVSIAS